MINMVEFNKKRIASGAPEKLLHAAFYWKSWQNRENHSGPSVGTSAFDAGKNLREYLLCEANGVRSDFFRILEASAEQTQALLKEKALVRHPFIKMKPIA